MSSDAEDESADTVGLAEPSLESLDDLKSLLGVRQLGLCPLVLPFAAIAGLLFLQSKFGWDPARTSFTSNFPMYTQAVPTLPATTMTTSETTKDTRIATVELVLLPFILYAAFARRTAAGVTIGGYMMVGFAMNVSNKKAAHGFDATCLLVIIQMVFADIVMVCTEYRNMTYKRWGDLMKWMVMPFFFASMLATSTYAFREMSMSTVLILRNLLPLFALAIEKVTFDAPKVIGWKIVASMIVALIGTCMYGATNVSVSRKGACLILANCAATVANQVLQRMYFLNKEFSVSVQMCMLLNNVFGILPVFIFAVAKSETYGWHAVVQATDSTTWCWVVMSSFCGCCLGVLGLKLQKIVSATTFLVLQNINKVGLIIFGMVLMGDEITGLSLIGCIISLCGALWYGFVRLPAETKESTQDETRSIDEATSHAEGILEAEKEGASA